MGLMNFDNHGWWLSAMRELVVKCNGGVLVMGWRSWREHQLQTQFFKLTWWVRAFGLLIGDSWKESPWPWAESGFKGALLFGKCLEVNFSKHPNITTGADSHDYSNSNLNRFNRNAAKNYRYCCSPTKMIHLSTLPQDVTEEEIVAHLEEHGTIENTKLFEMNGKKQALVLFETEEQATEALVCKHATPLGGSTIRISFSQLQTI
ncbi:unnamed protein product [Ilex paraguariensis]|uniref:RRM domain-containing protein n=1 Tax=Ilex paraguariensis TaxID=185542 RepID=A0ABC8SGB9_9AQUA